MALLAHPTFELPVKSSEEEPQRLPVSVEMGPLLFNVYFVFTVFVVVYTNNVFCNNVRKVTELCNSNP